MIVGAEIVVKRQRSWRALMAVALLLPLAAGDVRAVDLGVSLQTSRSSSYKGVMPLSPGTTGLLKASIDSDDRAKIGHMLRQLKDGDVFVLTMHSNPDVFAVGKDVFPWSDFWTTFGIAKPPRLAAAILAGCMVNEMKSNGQEIYIPIKPEQVAGMRKLFGAEVTYMPPGGVNPLVASTNTYALLQALLAGKKLGDIGLGGNWAWDAAPNWKKPADRWKGVTLADLRKAPTDEAYLAGLAVGLGRDEMKTAYPKYNGNPETAAAFRKGFNEAGNAAKANARNELDRIRKLLDANGI